MLCTFCTFCGRGLLWLLGAVHWLLWLLGNGKGEASVPMDGADTLRSMRVPVQSSKGKTTYQIKSTDLRN